MSIRPCSCEGKNHNCPNCHGTGYIGNDTSYYTNNNESYGSNRTSFTNKNQNSRSNSKSANKYPAVKKPCPYCQKKVKSTGLEHHIRHQHPEF